MYDVLIVGGSYAGLSAALQLARARRRVLVVDAGLRRNRFAAHSHGFLGQDGRAPGAIVADARRQVEAYPTVTIVDGEVVSAEKAEARFIVQLADDQTIEASRIIIATGVVDILPDIPGLSERWGKSVFTCPYCDGYELDRGPVAVIATGEHSYNQAMLLPDWAPTTYFLNGAYTPSAEQREELSARGVTIEETPIREVAGERADIHLAGGRVLPFVGIFTAGRVLASPIVEQLGCALQEGPHGASIHADARRASSVAGVFACGDVTRGTGSIALAVGDGAMAAAAAHRSLIFDVT